MCVAVRLILPGQSGKVSQVLERRIGILWQTGKERHFRNSKKKVETSLANCKEFLMVVGN